MVTNALVVIVVVVESRDQNIYDVNPSAQRTVFVESSEELPARFKINHTEKQDFIG